MTDSADNEDNGLGAEKDKEKNKLKERPQRLNCA